MAPSRSKARKTRKAPLVSSIAAAPPSISRATAQARISDFHTSLKRKRAGPNGSAEGGSDGDAGSSRLKGAPEIDHEALDAYQKLSRAGQGKQRGGDSSKVLVPWLQELRAATATKAKIRYAISSSIIASSGTGKLITKNARDRGGPA